MASSNKKFQISQDAFDAVVKESMDDFGMDLEEALEDAIKTFQMQGVDLKGIITDGTGSKSIAEHPVVEAIAEIQHATVAFAETHGGGDLVEQTIRALEKLDTLCNDGVSENISIAGRYGGVEAGVSAFNSLGTSRIGRVLALKTLTALVQDAENKDTFQRFGGPEMLMRVVTDENESVEMKMHACSLIAASAMRNELVKEKLMDLNAAEVLTRLLKENGLGENVVQSICNAFRSLVTADDDRVVASKAFSNARAFADAGMVEAMLSTLHLQSSSSTVPAVCMALKSLAVNESICKMIADQRGIDLIFQAMDESLKRKDKALARNACSLLSQLAGSDENKDAIVHKGGLKRVINFMMIYSDDPSVIEETLTLMAVLSLRSPTNAMLAAKAGALDMAVEAMENHPTAANVQRQACKMLRNFAVRSAEIRSAILDKGLDRLIRRAKSSHASCKDAASAALRDLGFDDYNS